MSVTGISSLSNSRSYAEMAEFWDTHDLTDYATELEEADVTFDPSIRRKCEYRTHSSNPANSALFRLGCAQEARNALRAMRVRLASS